MSVNPVARVPKVYADEDRLRRFTDRVSDILSALILGGVIVQSGPGAWTTTIFIGEAVSGGTPGAVLIVGPGGLLSQVPGGLTGFF